MTIHELQCTLAQATYEEYQKQLYGLKACHSDYDENLMEEWKLLLDWKKSGVTCPSKKVSLDAAKNIPKVLPVTQAYVKALVMTFVQSNPAGIWLIQHNLGYNPLVEIYDNNNTPIPGSLKYLDKSSLQVTFNSIIGGKAYLYQT